MIRASFQKFMLILTSCYVVSFFYLHLKTNYMSFRVVARGLRNIWSHCNSVSFIIMQLHKCFKSFY